jgi:5-formyltetrahydrofolate cyclo-ligase
MSERSNLRERYRQARRDLPDKARNAALERITERCLASRLYQEAEHVALYMACDGEVDVTAILLDAFATQRSCYLPVLTGDKAAPLAFALCTAGTAMAPNRYQILEPEPPHIFCAPEALDLVIVPLVAFSPDKHRLGMGAGYYDRAFSFRKESKQNPALAGVAFDCQRYTALAPNTWDIPCDAIITPSAFL